MTQRGRTPERRELDRLIDIQESIENIQTHPQYKEGQMAWVNDKYFRGYCERQLGIIGEAAVRLTTDFDYENAHPEIPWRQIKGLRNILVHMYWGSDPKILWDVIKNYVPTLKKHVDVWVAEKKLLLEEELTESDNTKHESKLAKRLRELGEQE